MVIILGTIEGAVSAARILALSGLNHSKRSVSLPLSRGPSGIVAGTSRKRRSAITKRPLFTCVAWHSTRTRPGSAKSCERVVAVGFLELPKTRNVDPGRLIFSIIHSHHPEPFLLPQLPHRNPSQPVSPHPSNRHPRTTTHNLRHPRPLKTLHTRYTQTKPTIRVCCATCRSRRLQSTIGLTTTESSTPGILSATISRADSHFSYHLSISPDCLTSLPAVHHNCFPKISATKQSRTRGYCVA